MPTHGQSSMNYDSWKLASNADSRAEVLADRCSDIEAFVDGKLGLAVTQANSVSEGQWEAEPVLAEWDDDGTILLELNLRLKRVPVSGNPGDLLELAETIVRLGETLASMARNNQTVQGLKLAPSVQERGSGQQAGLG